MLFRRAKKTLPFMKRGVKKLFLRIDILSSVLKKIHMKGDSFAKCSKVSFKRSSLKS
nr:MAG TPA: hypothetical protein [Caudoviricetes sp.]